MEAEFTSTRMWPGVMTLPVGISKVRIPFKVADRCSCADQFSESHSGLATSSRSGTVFARWQDVMVSFGSAMGGPHCGNNLCRTRYDNFARKKALPRLLQGSQRLSRMTLMGMNSLRSIICIQVAQTALSYMSPAKVQNHGVGFSKEIHMGFSLRVLVYLQPESRIGLALRFWKFWFFWGSVLEAWFWKTSPL